MYKYCFWHSSWSSGTVSYVVFLACAYCMSIYDYTYVIQPMQGKWYNYNITFIDETFIRPVVIVRSNYVDFAVLVHDLQYVVGCLPLLSYHDSDVELALVN